MIKTGEVQYYNETRGFGILKDHITHRDIFIYSSLLPDSLRKGDQVSYELEGKEEELQIVGEGVLRAGKVQKVDVLSHYAELIRSCNSQKNIEIRLQFALLLKRHFRDYDASKRQYMEILQTIAADDSRAHYNFGNLLREQFEDYEAAKKHYEKAMEMDEGDYKARNNLANLLKEHFLDYEGARRTYTEALTIEPKNDFSHYEVGEEIYFREAGFNPDESTVHLNYALLLRDHFAAYNEVKEHCLKAVEVNKHNFDAHYCLGEMFEKHLNDRQAAQEHYLEARTLNSNKEGIKQFFIAKYFKDLRILA